MLSHFLDPWRSITSNRFVLNMVQGHCLQIRSCPVLFCNFWQFSVMVAAAHPIIQKEVDELLSKGAIEPSGGTGFYPVCLLFLSVLVASGPYLTLSGLIFICLYLILRCLLSEMCNSNRYGPVMVDHACLQRVCDTDTQATQLFTLETFYSKKKTENNNVQ